MSQADQTRIDISSLRSTLGAYPTGVAVVTTSPRTDRPAGMTINSFCSVSLEPPLVAWCVDRAAASFEVFSRCRGFILSILDAGQEAVARRFATRGADKFAGIGIGHHCGPVIPGACAWLRCEVVRQISLGDHVMIVGRVQRFQDRGGEPLVFARGKFNALENNIGSGYDEAA